MSARVVDTTITYLATQRPPRELPAKPTGFRLDLMCVENIPLHYYRYLYRTVGSPWFWFERLLLDDASLSHAVHRDEIEIHVLHADGAPAGYYELDFGTARRTNLAYFGLMPEWTGRKIGPWLLGRAVADAFSRGAERVTVNTCTLDHPSALPLYQRLGFEIVTRESRRLRIPASIADDLGRQTAAL